MKRLVLKSIKEFVQEEQLKKLNDQTLCIFDIDGVFFNGILDWREIVGIIATDYLEALKKILQTKTRCWIFTNRMSLFRIFPYIKQLKNILSEFAPNQQVMFCKNSNIFLTQKQRDFAVIMNARKPSIHSQKVVEEGINDFKEVFYFSAQDFPIIYSDRKLLDIIEKKTNTDNLTFVDIRS